VGGAGRAPHCFTAAWLHAPQAPSQPHSPGHRREAALEGGTAGPISLSSPYRPEQLLSGGGPLPPQPPRATHI